MIQVLIVTSFFDSSFDCNDCTVSALCATIFIGIKKTTFLF